MNDATRNAATIVVTSPNGLEPIRSQAIARLLRLLVLFLLGSIVSMASVAQDIPGVPVGRSCPERFPAEGNLAKAFFDVGWQSCWSCPVGYNRSAAPVTDANACSKAISPVEWSRATLTGTFNCKDKYGADAFEDSITSACWRCPEDAPVRTWSAVDAWDACQVKPFDNRKAAIRLGTPTCDTGFKDGVDGGTCWTCPQSFSRTVYHVKSESACEKAEDIAVGTLRGRQDAPPVADCPAAPAVPNLDDMSLFVVTDLHFGKVDVNAVVTSKSLLRHAAEMNALPSRNVSWLNSGLESDTIGEPVAIVTTGDNTHYGHDYQFEFFRWVYEPEQRTLKNYSDAIRWPVFVGLGNHDLDGDCYRNNCAERSFNYISTRHRAGCMGVANFHAGSHNYSWDMNKIHFVQLHKWAGDTLLGKDGEVPRARHEQGLTWLKEDLEKMSSANKGRAVVLFQHFPLLSSDWTDDEKQSFWRIIENYNVIAMFVGHEHSSGYNEYSNTDVNIKNPAKPDFRLRQFRGATGGENGVGKFFAVRFKGTNMAVALLRWQSVAPDTKAVIDNTLTPFTLPFTTN